MSTVSRRDFLRTAGLVAGAGILGGCATGTSSSGSGNGALVLQSSCRTRIRRTPYARSPATIPARSR